MAKNNVLFWAFGIFLAIMVVMVTNFGYDVFVTPPDYPVYTGNTPVDTANQQTYDNAMQSYNFNKFILFSILGAIMVIGSLFVTLLPFDVTMTFAGFILLIQSLAMNWQDKIKVFIMSILILVLIIVVLYRKLINKKGW